MTTFKIRYPTPFFDSACIRYEALRSVNVEHCNIETVTEKYGLTEYEYRKSLSAFQQHGAPALIGLDSQQLTEELPLEVERMVFVLKKARAWVPATKMVLIMQGFDRHVPLSLMRHLYASYGWALGTKRYEEVDFCSLNLKVIRLCQLHSQSLSNATLSRLNDELVLIWQDHYPEKQHQALEALFTKLNEESQHGLPFLGGLKLRFEIAPPRSEQLHNKCKRDLFEF